MKKILVFLLSVIILTVTFTAAGILSASADAAPLTLGDINGDGNIKANDARLALRYAAKLEYFTDAQIKSGDINKDGSVKANDARTILRISAGLDSISNYGGGETEPSNPVTPPEKTPLSAKEVYETAKYYTYEINCEGADFYSRGSGFATTYDGLIITNYHVIENCYYITVTDCDGNEYEVDQIMGFDADKDIAVLKIDTVTTPAELCYDYDMAEKCYTLGSSLGLTGTFADGIISNPVRYLSDYCGGAYSLIQMTAPISSGNSGGPLINEYGQVIGINSYGIDEGENLLFAIPVSMIDTVYLNPMSVSEFSGGYNPYDDVPDILTPDMLELRSGDLYLKPGGTAVIPVILDARLDDSLLSIQSNPDFMKAEWSLETFYDESGEHSLSFVALKALDYCENSEVTIHYDNFLLECKFNVWITDDGWEDYGNLAGFPDFGALSGIIPYGFTNGDESVSYLFSYDYETIYMQYGYVDGLIDDYINLLYSFGFDKTDEDYDDLGNHYMYFSNENDDVMTLAFFQDENGIPSAFAVYVLLA